MVIDGNLSLGNFTAFYIYLVMLAGPLRMLGVAMGMAQRAIASGNRMFEIIDREPTDPEPAPSAPPLPAGGGRVELRDVTLRYDGSRRAPKTSRCRRSTTSRSRSRPGRRWRWSGRRARARRASSR